MLGLYNIALGLIPWSFLKVYNKTQMVARFAWIQLLGSIRDNINLAKYDLRIIKFNLIIGMVRSWANP